MSRTRVPAPMRRLVRQRAKACCEYCLIPEAIAFARHQVDHIEAEKHGGSSAEDNLALSCILCNQYKGSDLTFHYRAVAGTRMSVPERLGLSRMLPLINAEHEPAPGGTPS
jgi:5-methylcytosine-specific restriction endonuclease McrA